MAPGCAHRATEGSAASATRSEAMPTTRKTTDPTSWVRFHDLSDVSVQGVRIPKSQLLRTRRRATPITHSRTDKVTTETELTLTSTPTVESTAATWIAAMSNRVAIPIAMYARADFSRF